jgi:hypothetical protein
LFLIAARIWVGISNHNTRGFHFEDNFLSASDIQQKSEDTNNATKYPANSSEVQRLFRGDMAFWNKHELERFVHPLPLVYWAYYLGDFLLRVYF